MTENIDVAIYRFLQNRCFALFAGKHLCWSLYLLNLQASSPVTLLRRDSDTAVSCEYCEIFRKNFFTEHTSGGCFFWNNSRWERDLKISDKSKLLRTVDFLKKSVFQVVPFFILSEVGYLLIVVNFVYKWARKLFSEYFSDWWFNFIIFTWLYFLK